MNTVEAKAIIEAARTHAEGMGKAVTICVLNATGLTMGLERVGEPGPFTSMVAEGKAAGAAFMGRDSVEIAGMAERLPAFINAMIARHNGRFLAVQGAVVLRRDGEIAGAVGVSGATAEEDEEIARAGAAVFK